MESENTAASPGWYPTPNAPGSEAYWDGRSWTATRPSSHAHPARRGPSTLIVAALVAGGILAAIGGAVVVNYALDNSPSVTALSGTPAPAQVDTTQMESDLLQQISDRRREYDLTAAQVSTLTADCSDITDDTPDAYPSCVLDDGVTPTRIAVELYDDGTYAFVF